MKDEKKSRLRAELQEHVPYTLFSAAAGLCVVAVVLHLAPSEGAEHAHENGHEGGLFEVFHACHIFFSAIATTAMFCYYEKRWLKGGIVGIIGALVFCQISDVLLPYVGGRVVGKDMELHFVLAHAPGILIPFLLLGVLGGITSARTIRRSTIYSHSAHVFVSTMASLLYMVAYGFGEYHESLGAIVVVLAIAVWVPCCLSDIVFPIMLSADGRRRESEEYDSGHHTHAH